MQLNVQARSVVSITSLISASSNSSGSGGSTNSGQSSSMAVATAVHKMDGELRCPSCHRYFNQPVLLPCGHSLCKSCTINNVLPASEPVIASAVHAVTQMNSTPDAFVCGGNLNNFTSTTSSTTTGGKVLCSARSHSVNTSVNAPSIPSNHNGSSHSDSDQLSVVSETDSGVVVSSRPGSYIDRLPIVLCQHTSSSGACTNMTPVNLTTSITCGLTCTTCNRVVCLLDEKGLNSLPRNRALERVLAKFVSSEILQQHGAKPLDTWTAGKSQLSDPLERAGGPLCQLCEESDPKTGPSSNGNVATTWCEQCDVFYCQSCRTKYHPSRGPLLRHLTHRADKGVELVRQKRLYQPPSCSQHEDIPVNQFCVTCQTAICHLCAGSETNQSQDPHAKHEVHPLASVCKAKKVCYCCYYLWIKPFINTRLKRS